MLFRFPTRDFARSDGIVDVGRTNLHMQQVAPHLHKKVSLVAPRLPAAVNASCFADIERFGALQVNNAVAGLRLATLFLSAKSVQCI